jgi:phage I-like protein
MNTKTFFILFLFFAWLNPVKAQYEFNAVEKARMAKARVKTQTQWTHDFVDGKPSAKGYISSVIKYDTRGNVIEEINYNDAGAIISVSVHQYDSRDNKVNFERYQDNRKKLLYSQKVVYDAKGNKIREYGYDGASLYSNTFQYDENGRLSEIRYTVENVLVEKRQLKYSGGKTEISIFDANNNLTFRQENTHNDKGLLVSEIKTGGKGNVVHSLDLQYNNAGALTEEVKKRADDKFDYQKLYQYDSGNRPIKEETVNMDGTRFVSREYQYNNQGDLILES